MERVLSSTDDAKWGEDGRMYFGGKLMKTAPRGGGVPGRLYGSPRR